MQQRNLFLFVVLTALILVGWMSLSRWLWPPPEKGAGPVASKDEPAKKPDEPKKPDDKKKPADRKPDKKPERPVQADLRQLPPTPWAKLVRLGSKDRRSPFHLYAELDPRGAGLRSLWLNKFQAADDHGLPVWEDPAGKTVPAPLELVPAHLNTRSPSFLLFAYDVKDVNEERPLDTLARVDWEAGERTAEEKDGRRVESVTFRAETQGVVLTKTYSLAEGEYHLGLSVTMRRKEAGEGAVKFRYQMTGAHGLPVEGKWYTNIFRNALIARLDRNGGGVSRDLQELRQISHWGGGGEVRRDAANDIIWLGVANQYFASVLAVDNDQAERGFLRQARPTLETALFVGTVTEVADDGASLTLRPEKGPDETFQVANEARAEIRARVQKGARIGLLHHTASYNDRTREYAEVVGTDYFLSSDQVPPALWEDDITVRVSTEPIELKGGEAVEHKYLLYHGPVKVNQLFPPPGLSSKPFEQGGVRPELYGRYHDALHLNTLTDYHSPGFMGRFASAIYWTDLVIKCTNVMHAVLGYLRAVIPSYGLCIIVLTVLVRGLMFPLSRKQALMSLRMQQLAPELKKLQEKYKDDRQALGMAQMDLYRKYGVNPFGSCWVLLLQMPIFMGLYFALQESTHFRLAEFWPTWIKNLAAPDMLYGWTDKIPFLSRVEDYGSFLYLGPYFNLLPVIAVVLMIFQQKMLTPPPADEQQAMQQKMMKYMMVFFGLMFYKVAAGLCLYFIASSVWGFCERKLLPKAKPVVPRGDVSAEGYFQKLLRRAQGEQVTPAPAGVPAGNGGVTPARPSGKRRKDRRRQGAGPAEEEGDGSVLGRWRKRLRDWWVAVLKEAEKKNRG